MVTPQVVPTGHDLISTEEAKSNSVASVAVEVLILPEAILVVAHVEVGVVVFQVGVTVDHPLKVALPQGTPPSNAPRIIARARIC